MYVRYVPFGAESKINGNKIKILVGPFTSSTSWFLFYMTMVSRHQNFWLTLTIFSVLWMLITHFLLWGILALTLNNFEYFPRSVCKLCKIYSIFPLTFLWSLKLLVLMKKTVCDICEGETKFWNKIWIRCKIRIDCNKFCCVLLFVQNVILKDKVDRSKRFMIYIFFWNALDTEKERKNATRHKECRKLPNRLSYLNRRKERAFYFPTWFSTASADGTMRIDSTRYVKHVKRLHSNNMMPQQCGVWHS